MTLCLQVELHGRVYSLPPAALVGERLATHSAVSCCKALNLHLLHRPATGSFFVMNRSHSCHPLSLIQAYDCLYCMNENVHVWLTNNMNSEHLWWHLDFADLIYDIVADCSDNVPTRYLVNDACVLSGKPLVSASALRMEGQVTQKGLFSCINVARVHQLF